MRKVLRWFLYVAYLASFVLAVDYFVFYRPFVGELRSSKSSAEFDTRGRAAKTPELMRLVGSLVTNRRNSFRKFEMRKPDGVTRVCAFGDSFTYGDEVEAGADYPSLLERMLERAGIEGVQVLNFGSPWHGFQQAFMLWERAGSRYRCDYALLGPNSFWEARGTAFNHTDLLSPYYIHARYVLDDEDVRLVEIEGDNFRERFERYWSFLPTWKVLRYDRNAPAFLRALIPKGRTLPNPFYYRSESAEEEATAIWRILLGKMSESDMSVVMTNKRKRVVQLADSLGLPADNAWFEYRFPYSAGRGHNSVWGNQMVALKYFAALVEGETPAFFRIATSNRRNISTRSNIPRKRALSDYRSLVVEINRKDAGIFAVASKNYRERGIPLPTDLLGMSLHSLLAILEPGESLLDAAFVPLPYELNEGAELRLHVEGGGVESDLAIARVRLLDPCSTLESRRSPSSSFAGRKSLLSKHRRCSGQGRRVASRFSSMVKRSSRVSPRVEVLSSGPRRAGSFRSCR